MVNELPDVDWKAILYRVKDDIIAEEDRQLVDDFFLSLSNIPLPDAIDKFKASIQKSSMSDEEKLRLRRALMNYNIYKRWGIKHG